MEILVNADAIIDAAETRMAEIGSEIAQRMIVGKNSPDLLDRGQRILTLKKAYHVELEDKEKEAVLYCLRRFSEQYDLPALTTRNILGSVVPEPEEEEPFVDFYIGSLSDADGYIGTDTDAVSYTGTV